MLLYKSTMEYFKPMMRSLRKRDIPADLLAGIWIIVQDIKDRNYLHANTTYMSLAVGAHQCLAHEVGHLVWILCCCLTARAAWARITMRSCQCPSWLVLNNGGCLNALMQRSSHASSYLV